MLSCIGITALHLAVMLGHKGWKIHKILEHSAVLNRDFIFRVLYTFVVSPKCTG